MSRPVCGRRWPIAPNESEQCGEPAVAGNPEWEMETCEEHLPEHADPWAMPLPITTRLLRGIAVLLSHDPFAGWTEGEMALGAR